MGFAGNTSVPLTEAKASKKYSFLRSTQLFFALQNAFKAPRAKKYVDTLFKEAPEAKEVVKGKLSIVTGVTVGGTGYHMAEELALNAGMSVILMGRNSSKLEKAEKSIRAEAKKRGVNSPVLYCVLYDLDDLSTVKSAADEASKIANERYGGKIHVLINNAGGSCPVYQLSKQGIEGSVARNFLAPHLLTANLLPLLKAASTTSYKPRCVFVASLGYSLTLDYDPLQMLKKPNEGGAPDGTLKFDKHGNYLGQQMTLFENYGRAKLGCVATAHHWANIEPSINFTSQHPGSIVSSFGKSLGFVGVLYYYGFYFFNFSPSQGARAALRAALDPDFNTVKELQGAYLHADGNPWPKDSLRIIDPDTNKSYTWNKYAKAVYNSANTLIANVLNK